LFSPLYLPPIYYHMDIFLREACSPHSTPDFAEHPRPMPGLWETYPYGNLRRSHARRGVSRRPQPSE
jgi:hypothetical protein